MTGAHRTKREPRRRPSYTGLRRWAPAIGAAGAGLVIFAAVDLTTPTAHRAARAAGSEALGATTAFEPYSVLADTPATTPNPATIGPLHLDDAATQAFTPAPHVVSVPPVRRGPQTAPAAPTRRPVAAARTGAREPVATFSAPPRSPTPPAVAHAPVPTSPKSTPSPTPTATPSATPAPTTTRPSATAEPSTSPTSPGWLSWLTPRRVR